MILPNLEIGQKSFKSLVRFLGDLKTPKFLLTLTDLQRLQYLSSILPVKLTTREQSQFGRDFFLVKLKGSIIKSSHLTDFFLLFQSRGCGILEFGSEAEAKQAVERMHETNYKGRRLVVNGFKFNPNYLRKQNNPTPRFDAERDELRRSPPSDYKYVDFYFISFRDHSHIIRQIFFGHLFTFVTTLISRVANVVAHHEKLLTQ